jgi:hypothetical protein
MYGLCLKKFILKIEENMPHRKNLTLNLVSQEN